MEQQQLPQEEVIKRALKGKGYTIDAAAKAIGVSRRTFYNKIDESTISEDFAQSVKEKLGVDIIDELEKAGLQVKRKATGDDLRKKKAFGDTDEVGIVYVPIAAQAGYAKHFTDNVFVSDLERIYLPGLKYSGDNYRYFEVEGDSMLPTMVEGMQVIAQKVEQTYWKEIIDYYVYVVVTNTQVMIKRLYKLDEKHFVVISDNEELYPQFKIEIRTIRELWLVKRKLDWEMPPPKQFQINF